MGFDGFWNVFLLLLKIERPGRLFRQIRYVYNCVFFMLSLSEQETGIFCKRRKMS